MALKRRFETPNQDYHSPRDNFFSRNLYRYELWTGLYMLSPAEKILINTFTIVGSALWFYYLGAFFKGFVEGFWG
ncbi:hypothetical protein TL16_g03855 [Triparma laevis f. inornata]|uniref:Uncharacterized protein n=2 Tax=Triparma laevis TaxID=1534972 RepID=A0A9W7F9C2_9STRA|nr:hypothetical protein TL16_g03855 [Triparma laevis f. inornata]GMI08004.1 hypothetical protein TrLO_g102 [Triparma laevis f. longispina]